MKTLQTLRGPFSSVLNVFMLGLLLIGFSGRASGNICFEAIRFDNSDIPVIQTTLALKVSKYFIPEIFTPTAPDKPFTHAFKDGGGTGNVLAKFCGERWRANA